MIIEVPIHSITFISISELIHCYRILKTGSALLIMTYFSISEIKSQDREVWDTLYFTNGQVLYGTLKKSIGKSGF